MILKKKICISELNYFCCLSFHIQGRTEVWIIGGGASDHDPNYWGGQTHISTSNTKISTWKYLDFKIIGGAAAPLAPPGTTALR